jgi:hypothetical protein
MTTKRIDADDLDHILHNTEALWQELRGQSIFITGGTGFFWRWLLESFCHANRSLSLDAQVTLLTHEGLHLIDLAEPRDTGSLRERLYVRSHAVPERVSTCQAHLHSKFESLLRSGSAFSDIRCNT